jgi:SAM-dependent methyltransferase
MDLITVDDISIHSKSFRDPDGQVVVLSDRVVRIVNQSGMKSISALQSSKVADTFLTQGKLMGSRILDEEPARATLAEVGFAYTSDLNVVEHERIDFPSYPYEWSPAMLTAAANLTLDLAEGLLSDGIGLKDGTPYNVLFKGAMPVFIDVLSLEPRRHEDPVWLPYAQFLRTFLLPLLANRHFGVPLSQTFLTRRDGLEPEELYRWCSPLQRVRPPFLSNVSLPKWLSGKADAQEKSLYQTRSESPEKAEFILRALFRRLRKVVQNATPQTKTSRWSDYMDRTNNYSADEALLKKQLIAEFLMEFKPSSVLDVGCNTGLYSVMAADAGAEVIATDLDPVVIDAVWHDAHQNRKNILPLVIDLSRPSPSTGWRNRECPSFLERAIGRFDAVFMLAVIHHLLVSERIPLAEIIGLAADLTRRYVVIEFVAPEDPQFQRLTRGRQHLHRDLTVESFEKEALKRFEIVRKTPIQGTNRLLYLWRKRQV